MTYSDVNGSSDDMGSDNEDSDYIDTDIMHNDTQRHNVAPPSPNVPPKHVRTSLPPIPPFSMPTSAGCKTKRLQLISKSDHSFQWSDGGHTCTHHHSPPLEKSELVDSSCAVLSFFGCFYSPTLGSIVSRKLNSIIPRDFWDKRFKVPSTGQDFKDLVKHIEQAFGISEDQTIEKIYEPIKDVAFSRLPPGLPAPSVAWRCPHCKLWYTAQFPSQPTTTWGGLRSHWKRNPNCKIQIEALKQQGLADHGCQEALFQKAYASNVFSTVQVACSLRLFMARDWEPSSLPTVIPRLYAPPPITAAPPGFLVELGWKDLVDDLDIPLPTLLSFLSLPMPRLYVANEQRGQFEVALSIVVRILKTYLQHIDNLLSTYHGRVREEITRGFQPQTYQAYGTTTARIFIFVLRVKFALKRRDTPSSARLPLQKLLLTSQQLRLFEDLYQVLMNSTLDDDRRASQAAGLMHKILVALVTTVSDPSQHVGTVVEQVLTLEMRTSEGGTRLANFLTGECARLHHLWLSAFAHSAILGGFDRDYVLPNTPLSETVQEGDASSVVDGETGDGEASIYEHAPDDEEEIIELEEETEALNIFVDKVEKEDKDPEDDDSDVDDGTNELADS
ncbi:hypothetical protein H0H87_011483 [Tephrocybe sp. NHM501043]|nr:hypothetical protein H0H87_011483 [Tephrocybe sp. NHM501043]